MRSISKTLLPLLEHHKPLLYNKKTMVNGDDDMKDIGYYTDYDIYIVYTIHHTIYIIYTGTLIILKPLPGLGFPPLSSTAGQAS